MMTRRLDELNRIALPREVVSKFGWTDKTQIDLDITAEQSVILRAHRPFCKICGNNEDGLIPVKGQVICKACLDAANKTN
jgi:bifunctional DNA-binding transcriptional regulator/antitoxin component of YhaV-PrlF toxin-antitoxin module